MNLTIDTLRSSLDNVQLQSPDIIFWFQHTASPMLVTRRYPNDYRQYKWDVMKERRLIGVTTGFVAKGSALMDGFNPIYFDPPLSDAIHQIRVVRFVPDSGEISLNIDTDIDTNLDTWTVGCKMKSAAVIGVTDASTMSEREIRIEDAFYLQITLHSRKIEFK